MYSFFKWIKHGHLTDKYWTTLLFNILSILKTFVPFSVLPHKCFIHLQFHTIGKSLRLSNGNNLHDQAHTFSNKWKKHVFHVYNVHYTHSEISTLRMYIRVKLKYFIIFRIVCTVRKCVVLVALHTFALTLYETRWKSENCINLYIWNYIVSILVSVHADYIDRGQMMNVTCKMKITIWTSQCLTHQFLKCIDKMCDDEM